LCVCGKNPGFFFLVVVGQVKVPAPHRYNPFLHSRDFIIILKFFV